LWTDASEKGFGAYFRTGKIRQGSTTSDNASRLTNSAEMKYAPAELEIAALVYTLGILKFIC